MAKQDKDIIEKYKKKIRGEIAGDVDFSSSYSYEYKHFRETQLSGARTFYEKMCQAAERTLPITPSEKDAQEVETYLKLAHLETTPQGVFALAYFLSIISTIVAGALALVLSNLFIFAGGLIAAVIFLLFVPKIPKRILTVWRSQASDELVLAVLYLTIYMQHTPNLERAVAFVAKHVSPPLSIDFMKLLWDVETKTYSSITDALNDYAETWKDWDPQFVDALRIIETSLYEGNPSRKKEILDKAIEIILEGTQDRLLGFAHNLKSPLEILHMLGIVLPVMGLVVLPMAAAFMGDVIKWYHLVLLYNILLPIMVYYIGIEVLATRPAGAKKTDIYQFLNKKYKFGVTIGGKDLPIPAGFFGILAFLVVGGLPTYYFYILSSLPAEQFRDALFSQLSIFASILLIAAIGFGLGIYYYLSVSRAIKMKRRIEGIENTFTDSVFQLGQRLTEHMPVELAFEKIAESEKSEIAKFYKKVVQNIRNLGMDLRSAIFDKRFGALHNYPSAIVTSTMQVLVEGAKRSPEIVGQSLITISRYLRSVNRVSERMKDLLAETTSSMQMQVKVFVPVIAGIVVGLAILTTGILQSLGKQLGGLETGGAREQVGIGILDIFNIKDMISPVVFQLIVGLYVLQISYILSVLLSGIVHGRDTAEENLETGLNLIIASAIYLAVAGGTMFFFNQLAAPITSQLIL
ncbi:MAG: hypothetical protein J4451_01720 [DPANN group archaeon]|nr:hypothetical protein [DPANN group archaeon]